MSFKNILRMRRRHIGTPGAGQFTGIDHQASALTLSTPPRPAYYDEEGNGWQESFDEYSETAHSEIDGFECSISRDIDGVGPFTLSVFDRRSDYGTSVADDLEFDSREDAMSAASRLREEAGRQEPPSRTFPYRDQEGNGWDATSDEFDEIIRADIDGFNAYISRDLSGTGPFTLNMEDRRSDYVASVADDLEFASMEEAMSAASRLREEAGRQEPPSRTFPYRDQEGNGWDATSDEFDEIIHADIDGFNAYISRDLSGTGPFTLSLEDRRSGGLPVSMAEDLEFETLEAAMTEASRLRATSA